MLDCPTVWVTNTARAQNNINYCYRKHIQRESCTKCPKAQKNMTIFKFYNCKFNPLRNLILKG